MKYSQVFFLILILASAAFGQQISERDRGIQLYRQRSYQQAVTVLEGVIKSKAGKGDAEAWNTLGLAYAEKKDFKKAANALERAVALAPNSAVYHANLAWAYLLNKKEDSSRAESEKALLLDKNNVNARHVLSLAWLRDRENDRAIAEADRLISMKPDFADVYGTKSDALISKALTVSPTNVFTANNANLDLMELAVKTLEEGMRFDPALIEARLDTAVALRDFVRRRVKGLPPTTEDRDPAVEPVKVIRKPRALFTDQARSQGFQGNILVAAVLRSDGTVPIVLFLSEAPFGLDRNIIEAVKSIQFVPEKRNGKPVTKVVYLSYGFSIG